MLELWVPHHWREWLPRRVLPWCDFWTSTETQAEWPIASAGKECVCATVQVRVKTFHLLVVSLVCQILFSVTYFWVCIMQVQWPKVPCHTSAKGCQLHCQGSAVLQCICLLWASHGFQGEHSCPPSTMVLYQWTEWSTCLLSRSGCHVIQRVSSEEHEEGVSTISDHIAAQAACNTHWTSRLRWVKPADIWKSLSMFADTALCLEE